MGYYKVTYTQPGYKFYKIIEPAQMADSKFHAIELVFTKQQEEYPERKFYKAKLLK